jgi:hypothetical protein
MAVLLYWFAPAFKAGDKIFAVVLVGLLLSGGPILALNSLLETVPAQKIRTEVLDKESHHSTKGGDYFDVTVMLNGKETDIPVGGDTYRETEIGEIVTVEYHEGAFGIPYAMLGGR